MVAAGDHVQRDCAASSRCTGSSSAGVPNVSRSPWTMSTRHANRRQMRRARLVGPARRMQRVAEHDDSARPVEALRAEVRGHPAAHRLAADEQRRARRRPTPRVRSTTSRSTARAPARCRARAAARACRESRTSRRRCRAPRARRRRHHERVAASGAGAVREHQKRISGAAGSMRRDRAGLRRADADRLLGVGLVQVHRLATFARTRRLIISTNTEKPIAK